MALVCELKFNENGRTYYYNANKFKDLNKGDNVIVDFNDCLEIASVIKKPYETQDENIINSLQEIKRVATKQDLEQKNAIIEKSKKAYPKVVEAIKKFELSMKLLEVRYSFDQTKIFINYISENRVDFRELVKYLASIFKVRVELRQISTREEAKIFGGCGVCGKELCCSKFLDETNQVTIKMAKTQNMALNPSKINGVCGKLMCCLAYEFKEYEHILEKMPELKSEIKTTKGTGQVVYQDLLNEKVTIKVGDDENFKLEEVFLDEIIKEKEE